MKIYSILGGFFLSHALFAITLKPCESVGFELVAEHAILSEEDMENGFITSEIKREAIKLLKKCVEHYAVCIVGEDPKHLLWMNKKLVEPKNNPSFNPHKQKILFAMIQYVDPKNNASICIIAQNSFSYVLPWINNSWQINGTTMQKFEVYGDVFKTNMTPQSLYYALLKEHRHAVIAEYYHNKAQQQ